MSFNGRLWAAAVRIRMPQRTSSAASRTAAISRHLSSASKPDMDNDEVVFENNLAVRAYHLNRPKKLNALNENMLKLLHSKINTWQASDLCGVIVGRGVGRAFCAGGDVAGVILNAKNEATRHLSRNFFKDEFGLNYALAALQKPYVVIMEGLTMGGGVGLAAPASFRVATETTSFGMPETKIGYCPDVGATYYLAQLDGQIGTYLGLTGLNLNGRDVYDAGFATHYVTSSKLPKLLDALAALENPKEESINELLDEFATEREPDEPPPRLVGAVRAALDVAFGHNKVEYIFDELEVFSKDENSTVREWAVETLEALHLRSPTSLKVTLRAIREGKQQSLQAALLRELRIASALLNGASPDFITGVTTVVIDKQRSIRPSWNPETLKEVTPEIVDRFFSPSSKYLQDLPLLTFPDPEERKLRQPYLYCLPTENEIRQVISGDTAESGGTKITFEELVSTFQQLYRNKVGLKEKLTDVVSRRCETVDNDDGNFVWLQWKT